MKKKRPRMELQIAQNKMDSGKPIAKKPIAENR
jgi:hypothetical protein